MAFMLTRAKVRDFNTWKPAYDAHQPARSDAGLTEKYLLRNADDPNEVFLLFEAQDLLPQQVKALVATGSTRVLRHGIDNVDP